RTDRDAGRPRPPGGAHVHRAVIETADHGLMTMRRTKIVCTIGPASSSSDELDRLVAAGLDVARLNFSHGTHDEHADVVRRIREGEARWGRPIAILQDLQGPKIRLGTFGPRAAGRVGLEPAPPLPLSARRV